MQECRVLVVGLNGRTLMPTTPRKARILVQSKRAKVVSKVPYTIQLLYKTGCATQQLRLGADTGDQHIGFAVVKEDNAEVLLKADVELRKSMEKKELLAQRRNYRRGRRHRKTRYRHPKTKHRRKRVRSAVPDKNGRYWHTVKPEGQISYGRPKGWLPPSLQSKLDHHFFWINKFKSLLPESTILVIEAARFDIQHMMNPEIHGVEYQQGRMYSYENLKAYVFAKYNYTCPICGQKFDHEHRPRLHHITYVSKGATNNPDEYAPICEQCHTPDNHLPGGVLDKLREACDRKEYREPTFMNILRLRLYKAFPDAIFTYGNFTCADRKALQLEKTHANDAVAIALKGIKCDHVIDCDQTLHIKQIRRKKRSLHEAKPRKGPKGNVNRTAERRVKNVPSRGGFRLWDKIRYGNTICYISGFSGKNVYALDFNGHRILHTASSGNLYKTIPFAQIHLVQRSTNNYIVQMSADASADM